MEAAGAPRLDAERRELVRRSTRGAGQRGLAPAGQQQASVFLPMPSWVAEERSARLWAALGTCALGTLAY